MLLVDDNESVIFAHSLMEVWRAKMSVPGTPLSPYEHNSGVAAIAITLDVLADPLTTSQALQSSVPYADAVSYAPGPNNGKIVQVAGAFPPPTEPRRLAAWQCLSEILYRLGEDMVLSAGTPSTYPADARLIELYFEAADAAIPQRFLDANQKVNHAPDTMASVALLFTPILVYANSLQQIATPAVASMLPADTATGAAGELAARPRIEMVAAMYRARIKRDRMIAGGIGLGGLAVSGIAAAVMGAKRRRRRR